MSIKSSVHTSPAFSDTPQRSLCQVLAVGATDREPIVLTVNNVFVSTSPDSWTELTIDQVKQLKLTPETPSKFPSKYKSNVYYAIAFTSSVVSEYRFFVEENRHL